MDRFSQLFWELDTTTKTNEKVAAIRSYLADAASREAAWAIYFLAGKRIKRLIPTKRLRQWACEQAALKPWLFEECYQRVGDLAETISLVLPPPQTRLQMPLHQLVETELLPLKNATDAQQRETIERLWNGLEQPARFVLGKLITGAFRVGISRRLVQRAIAEWSGLDVTTIAWRMMGDWEPDLDFIKALVAADDGQAALSRPYPFFLANPLKEGTTFEEPLFGDPDDWVTEWKWDGIRAQVIKRANEVFIWSRGEELVTGQFPEISRAAAELPEGVVLDGEILAWSQQHDKPLEFQSLQRRLGRKQVSQKTIDNFPVVLLAFDLLEWEGNDIRHQSLIERQQRLRTLIDQLNQKVKRTGGFLFAEMNELANAIRMPPQVSGSTWSEWAAAREQSAELSAEGLMLKRKTSPYQVNRPVGDWWKWKVDPYTIDAVLIYAQRGHGRRASLYTDYTFAVWDDGELVPFAKAYSGLTDAEINQVDAYVRKHTEQTFGPVRSVTPQLVFELAFENIQSSSRHKSGIAVRFPRINRWRHDKQPEDADTLDAIKQMIGAS